MVMETAKEFCESGVVPKIYPWKLFKKVPEPEDSEKIVEEVRQTIIKHVNYIQSIADRRGKKFILCDQVSDAQVLILSS